MKKRFSLLLAAAVIMALIQVSCSGGGGGSTACTEPPIMITPGTWCIAITNSQNNCGTQPDTTPYPAQFSQNENNITATAGIFTYTGTVCGNRASMIGNNPLVSTQVDITFSDTSHGNGTTTWNNGTCGGVDSFTTHAGTCP